MDNGRMMINFGFILRRALIFSSFLVLLLPSPSLSYDENFVGPFASWLDLRRDYGAVGDGKADDTIPLQRALDDLVLHEKGFVLYIPSGVYRITRTLSTVRTSHTTGQGITLVGQDPATTTLSWDGAKNETMLKWDAWYAKISRLTFDGNGVAGVGLRYGPVFSTYNETSDINFKDLETGLLFGGDNYAGQAENEVLRCQFYRCGIGVKTAGWNSMDIWVWYSRFEDCGYGLFNEMGNWHAWQNLFLRSSKADMASRNLMVFSVVNNTSVGSNCFFDFRSGHTWGSPVSMTGNRILDPTGKWAVLLDNSGPYLLMDNVFRLQEGKAVKMTWGAQTFIGNSYSHADSVEERGHFRRINEEVVAAVDIKDGVVPLPSAPPRQQRKIFDVPVGADSNTIQEIVDRVGLLCREQPIIHFPGGLYNITSTITLPASCPIQLIGDGVETATRLRWAGQKGGTLLHLQGPSKVTLRDFSLQADQGRCLLVDAADQQGGQIFADQLNVNGTVHKEYPDNKALFVNGLAKTNILLRSLQGSGSKGTWVDVSGQEKSANQVAIYTGATSSSRRQINVQRNGRLVVRGIYHEKSADDTVAMALSGTGNLAIDSTRFSMQTATGTPTIRGDNFSGLGTIAASMLLPVGSKETCSVALQGNGMYGSFLMLNDMFWVHKAGVSSKAIWRDTTRPPMRAGMTGCTMNTKNRKAALFGFKFLESIGEQTDPARAGYGSGLLPEQGTVSDELILQHVAPLRTATVWLPEKSADNITDVRIFRVMASGGIDSTVEFRAGQAKP